MSLIYKLCFLVTFASFFVFGLADECVKEKEYLPYPDTQECCDGLVKRFHSDDWTCVKAKDCGKVGELAIDGRCCQGTKSINGRCFESCGLNIGVCPTNQFCDGQTRVCYSYEVNVNCGANGQAPINGRCCPPITAVNNGLCTLLETGRCLVEGDCSYGYSCCKKSGKCLETGTGGC